LAQEIFDLMGARPSDQDETELFALLARSISSYTFSQLRQLRGVVSYLSAFEKTPDVDKKLLLLQHNIDHTHSDVSLELYHLTSLLFEAKENAMTKGRFAHKPFFAFFSSFLDDSLAEHALLDVEKLLTFQEDLSGVETTAYNKPYNLNMLQSNLESSLASDQLEKELDTVSSS
jgi:hypothetical protein